MATPDLTLVSESTLPAHLDATLTSAKGYADTKKNEAITAAATDATTKANTAKAEAIADATTKYGGLPQKVTDLIQGRQLLDHQLNNLVELGRWRETQNAEATAENNHPFPYISDIEVYPIGSIGSGNVQQKVYGAPTFGGGFAVRSKYGTTWSDWQKYLNQEDALAQAKALLDSSVVQGKQLLDPQLNNLVEFGRWRQISNENATAENNYPFPYISDIEVYPVAANTSGAVQQKVFGASSFGGGIGIRSKYNGNWSEWDIYRTEEEILAAVSAMISEAMPASSTRTFPITLTFHAATSVDTRTSVQARHGFKLPATSKRWRVHFRNRNDRIGTLYPGALEFTGVGIGKHALGASGELTGNTVGVPATVSGPATTPANGDEWVTPWVESYPLEAYEEYLLPYGFTCAEQENHAGYGTAWTTSNAEDVFVAEPTGAVLGQPLLDVWIEAEFAADVPAMAYFGSSSAVGIGAEYVGRQSFANVHALAHGVILVMYAHSGSAMRVWNISTTKDQKWAHLDKPDGLLWAMGGNDLSDAGDLATMQSRFNDAWPIITAVTSTNVYLVTMTPRYGAANTPEFTALRQEYNEWLETLPGGSVACWDINERVTNSTDDSLLEKYAALPDTGHMNTAGYARAAGAITAKLASAVLA